MMKYRLACFLTLLLCLTLQGQQPKTLSYYLPAGVKYDSSIPKPSQVLGTQVGEWHVRPDQVVRYLETLANASDRCSIQTYALTHERRPCVVMTITSKKNMEQMARIKADRANLLNLSDRKPNTEKMPVVLWMGYGVHGDEPSGTNSSLLYAYHLAAAQGEEIEALLDQSIILLDPCLNPDGTGRFAHWANMHKGKQPVADPSNREHRQGWPSGRTNHYWFDLNRDWLLAQHPESRGRLAIFHEWRPNVVTDFHEMGTNSTYFFQPGVKSRHNPLIPKKNYDLTGRIAEFHAEALNKIGSLYYTRESFDDFYFGKGSTYPDVHGSVGILFEQASSRGHEQMSRYGKITFPFTIRNQLTTSMSTHRAAVKMRKELLDYQREFLKSSMDAAVADPIKAWVFQAPESRNRAAHLWGILREHKIWTQALKEDLVIDGKTFDRKKAFVVVGEQPQYRLIKSLFEKRKSFIDPVFYDVSAWNMFAAFDLDYAEIDASQYDPALYTKMYFPKTAKAEQKKPAAKDVYAYAFDWSSFHSAKLLNGLLDHGVQVIVAGAPFEAQVAGDKVRRFERGAIVIPSGIQEKKMEEVKKLIARLEGGTALTVYAIKSGLTPKGPDLGSPSMGSMRPVKPMILVGGSTSAYEAGEVWHLLDNRLGMRPSLIDARDFGRVTLADYTHIMAVSGAEGALKDRADDIKGWVRQGGILITQRSAAQWSGENLLGLKAKPRAKVSSGSAAKKLPTYADRSRNSALRRISGAIFNTTLDNTHPLGWGIAHKEMAVWRKGTSVMLPSKTAHNNPLRYTSDPLICGFAGDAAQKKLAGTTAASVDRLGSGVIVRFADNMNFRAYWRGTERLYLNAIFHARFVAGSGQALKDAEPLGHDDH